MSNKFYNIDEQRYWNNNEIWTEDGHEWSKSFGTTENIWNQHIFSDLKPVRGGNVTEIAPGHGRMTQFLSVLAGKLTVIDLNPNCIHATRQKLGNHVDTYLVGDGKTLAGVQDGSQDLVFSFDSFVHMHANVTAAYLKEVYRVLKPGGRAWIHHSNLLGEGDLSFQNLAGRAMMWPELFVELANNAGLHVIEQKEIWFQPIEGWNGLDTISILIK